LLLGMVLSVCTWFHSMVTLPPWLVSTDYHYYYYYYYYYYSEQSESSRNFRSRTVREDNYLLEAQTASISGTYPVAYRQGHVTDPAPVTAQWQLHNSRLGLQPKPGHPSLPWSMNCNRQGLKNSFSCCQSSALCLKQHKGRWLCASCKGESCWPGRGMSKAPKYEYLLFAKLVTAQFSFWHDN
jgi:hypothetical protein